MYLLAVLTFVHFEIVNEFVCKEKSTNNKHIWNKYI